MHPQNKKRARTGRTIAGNIFLTFEIHGQSVLPEHFALLNHRVVTAFDLLTREFLDNPRPVRLNSNCPKCTPKDLASTELKLHSELQDCRRHELLLLDTPCLENFRTITVRSNLRQTFPVHF